MVAITGYPFDSGAGAAVQEGEYSRMAQHYRTTGVIPNVLNEFEVYGDSTGMQVKVKTGQAIIKGNFAGNLTSEQTLSIASADPTLDRIDRVVLQVDWTNNEITLEVKTGTPAASPTAPSLTQTEFTVWEISLAQVAVDAAVSTIAAGDVTDERDFSRDNEQGVGSRSSVTVASGAITVEAEKGNSFYIVNGEGSASDTLTDINMSSPVDGAIFAFRATGSQVITVVNTGNIDIGDLDYLYVKGTEVVAFIYDLTAATWYLLSGGTYAGVKSVFIPAFGFYPLDLTNTVPVVINSSHPAYEFIDAADDYALINMEMPKDYDGGNLTFYIWWIPGTTGTNSVVWQIGLDMLADGEAYSANDDTDTVTDAAQNSITEVLRTAAITLTPTWVAGDLMRLIVGRLGTNGSDTLAGVANFIGVKMEYTTNKNTQE